ncbi:MAG: hypothetical protein ACE5JG_04760, partial [Planctomycetota bacterium]
MRRITTAMLVLAIGGAAGAGYLLGRTETPPTVPRSTPDTGFEPEFDPGWGEPEPDGPGEETFGAERSGVRSAAVFLPGDETNPADLLAAVRRHAGTRHGQKVVAAYVAQAAVRGSEMLPEIMDLLRTGEDVELHGAPAAVPGLAAGYPTLRMALLDAAAATGDPAATDLLREVAQTTASPVEIVFSAHLLERLDDLDRETAERALDSLARKLDPEQVKAIGSLVSRFVPAAARVSPAYAENLLSAQLRSKGGAGQSLRLLTPALYGLPRERVQDFVLGLLPDPGVPERAKRVFASRAVQRPEIEILRGLRESIEANQVAPRIAGSVARSAVASRAYGRMERRAYTALRQGDLDGALGVATRYRRRLEETRLTLAAARTIGAKLSPELGKLADIRRIRL